MNKKKAGIIIGIAVAVAAAGGGLWYFFQNDKGSSKDKVYVEAVSKLNSSNSGVQNRYAGIVEPQETWEVNKDEEKEVKAVLVAKGDKVEEGTPLFEYDTEDLKNELAQGQLELEEMQNEITSSREQINQLSADRNAAPEEEKLEYTTQIQSLENSIKQTEYNIESRKIELQEKQKQIDNAVVTSKIAGVVKSINDSGIDDMGNSVAYMTILATGDYRVKGSISEQNVWTIAEKQKVIIRSRIDEEKTWSGKISKIDTENQEAGNENMNMMAEGESAASATKYPFYVTLKSKDDLMLGQHVYIELDQGQTKKKDGLWLYDGYLVFPESPGKEKTPYVWVSNKQDKLEKRTVQLGEHDDELAEYEIVSGLSKDDCIAFPMEGLYEGVSTVKDQSEVDYSSPLYNQNGEEGEAVPEGEGEAVPEGEVLPEEEAVPVPEGEVLPEGEEMPENGLLRNGGEIMEGEEDMTGEEPAEEEEEPEEK